MRDDQLGVQVHCLRHVVRKGLPDALASIRRLGLGIVELVSFPGCRGNPWGDFGSATDLPARSIRIALDDAGLLCPSVMVNERELAPDQIDTVLDWVRGVGADRVVLTAFAGSTGSTLEQWRATLARTNTHAERCRERGIAFVLHTQPDLWAPVEDRRPVELLRDEVDPAMVRLEYDPSGAIMYGIDPASFLTGWHGAIHAVHLRDGQPAPEPVPYVPALPLGSGSVDWDAFLRASRDAAVEWYFLEMEVADPTAVIGALSTSLEQLAALGMPVSR
jgi:sugar phosphate isomerase/epimerase